MTSFLIAIAAVALQFLLVAMSSAKKRQGTILSGGSTEGNSSPMTDDAEFEEGDICTSFDDSEMFIPYADYAGYDELMVKSNSSERVASVETVSHTNVVNSEAIAADTQVSLFRDSFNLRDAVLYQTIMTAPYCNI